MQKKQDKLVDGLALCWSVSVILPSITSLLMALVMQPTGKEGQEKACHALEDLSWCWNGRICSFPNLIKDSLTSRFKTWFLDRSNFFTPPLFIGEVFILGIFFLFCFFFFFWVPWSPGPLIPWCPGHLVPPSSRPLIVWSPVPWSSGPLVLWSPWSPGPLVPCSSGLLVPWSSVLFRSFFSNLSFTYFVLLSVLYIHFVLCLLV